MQTQKNTETARLRDALEKIKTYAEIEIKLAQNAQDVSEAWARGVFATIAQIADKALRDSQF